MCVLTEVEERSSQNRCFYMRLEKCLLQGASSAARIAGRRQLEEQAAEFPGDVECFRSVFCFIAFHFVFFCWLFFFLVLLFLHCFTTCQNIRLIHYSVNTMHFDAGKKDVLMGAK